MSRLFNRILRLDRWSRERFTPLGRMLVAAFIAVGLFALNPRATLAYQLAILLFAVLVVALLWAPLFRPRLSARRRLPRYATVGVPLRYTLDLTLAGARGLEDLEVHEEPRTVKPAAAVADAAQDLLPRRGWRRTRVGYMRFMRAVRRLEGGRCPSRRVERLLPGRASSVGMELIPLRRGSLHLDRVRVTRTDPLGLFRAAVRVAVSDRVLVLPARYPVHWTGDGFALPDTRSGTSRARATGGGSDFARLREYRPRDPLRHIHWRAWARIGEPVVKEFHEENPSRNALVLDTMAPPGCTRAVFEEAVSVAASFVADPAWRSGRLDLLFAGEHQVHLSQGSEGEGVARMLEALAGVERSAANSFATLTQMVMQRVDGFSACVLVLLELDRARVELVHALRAAGVSTLVLVVAEDAGAQVRAAGADARTFDVAPGQAARVLASLSGAARPAAVHA